MDCSTQLCIVASSCNTLVVRKEVHVTVLVTRRVRTLHKVCSLVRSLHEDHTKELEVCVVELYVEA